MAEPTTYSAHALPCPLTAASPPADLASLARRYSALRLEALLTSPKAFASTHAIERTLTPEEWVARIWKSDAVVLVCVAHPAQDAAAADASPLAGEWVGSAILRGPLPAHDYAVAPSEGTPPIGTDDVETKWQMTAVFASAAHRGRGIGKLLIQAGKDYASKLTANPRAGLVFRWPAKVRLRVMIHPDNLVVLSLYSATGFVDAGRTTGKEAYRTNGDISLWALKLKSLTDDEEVLWTTALVAVMMEWLGETQIED